jgi:hypothetical protein
VVSDLLALKKELTFSMFIGSFFVVVVIFASADRESA